MNSDAGPPPLPKPVPYRYVGAGPGQGAIHRLLKAEPHECITWTPWNSNDDLGGWTWIGDKEEFDQNFKRV